MTAEGLVVLRFTGSEIYRDAQRAAEEIEGFMVERPSNLPRPAKLVVKAREEEDGE